RGSGRGCMTTRSPSWGCGGGWWLGDGPQGQQRRPSNATAGPMRTPPAVRAMQTAQAPDATVRRERQSEPHTGPGGESTPQRSAQCVSDGRRSGPGIELGSHVCLRPRDAQADCQHQSWVQASHPYDCPAGVRSASVGAGRARQLGMPTKRGNNEGSITKRANGLWEARITLDHGKRKSFYGKTRQEAARKLTAALRDRDAGLPVIVGAQTVGYYMA